MAITDKWKRLTAILAGKNVQNAFLLFGIMWISCMVMFTDYLFGNELMIFNDIGSDTWQQYIMNYTSIVNHLRDGSFALWDFTNGVGVNVFNFNLFDPFLMLLYGLGVVLGPAHMLIYINSIQILKLLLAGLAFYWFLCQFSFSGQAKVVAAYAYAFNGFLMVWGQHYQFGTAAVYLPLLLLFCEKFIRRKRGRALFPVMVFLCGIYSVYFTYMCLAATGLYLLFRILMLEDMSGKERLRRFFAGCGMMLLGIGMSLAVFLPMAAVLLNVSSRLDGGDAGLAQWVQQAFTPYSPKFYLSLLKRMFSVNLQNGFGLAKGPQHYAMNYYEDPVLFCSALTVFLEVQFLLVLRKAKLPKRSKCVLYAVAALIVAGVALPIGGTVFNYFVQPTQRYTFVLMPVLLLMLAWMWDYLRRGGRLSLILIAGVTVLMGWAYLEGWRQAGFAEYRRNILILTVTGLLTALLLIALNYLKQGQIRSLTMGVLALAVMVNVMSEGSTNYQARVTMKKMDTPAEVMQEETAQYEADRKSKDKQVKYRAEMNKPQDFLREMYRTDLQDALAYLEEKDGTFYRVEKDYISGTVAMDSAAQNYRGISTYNSVMNGYYKEFVETCAPELLFADHNHYTYWNNVEDNALGAFLGVKYILTGKEQPKTDGYKLLDRVGSLYIHENTADARTAHFYTRAITEDSLRKLCGEDTRERLLTEAVALDPSEEKNAAELESMSDLDSLSTKDSREAQAASYVTLDTPEKDSYLTGTIHAETDGYALFAIPYEDGWSLTIDGERTELLRGDIGFLACRVPEGDHTLTLTFHAPGLRAGIAGSVFFWLLYLAVLLFPKLKKAAAD